MADVLRIEIRQDGAGNLRASLAGIEGDLDRMDNANQRVANSANTLRNVIGGLVATISAGAIVRTIVEYERLQKTLEAVEGSAGKAALAFDNIKELARNAPFQVTQLTETYIRLKSFGLDPLDGTMQAIIDQSAKLGGSQESLRGITLALGQAWAKQKLQGEEILQLIERGVPVWELLQEATGKTAEELQELSSKGALGRDTIKALIETIGGDAAGAALKQMDTLGGSLSNLQDSAQQFAAALGEAGLTALVRDAADALSALSGEGREASEVLLPLITGLAGAKILGPIFTNVGAAAFTMSRQMGIAAGAAAGLKTALGLLGGPGGLIVGAATALTVWANYSRDAVDDTDALAGSIDNLREKFDELTASELRAAVIQQERRIAALQEEQDLAAARIETLNKQTRFADNLEAHNERLTIARGKLAEKTRELHSAEQLLFDIQRRLRDAQSSGAPSPAGNNNNNAGGNAIDFNAVAGQTIDIVGESLGGIALPPDVFQNGLDAYREQLSQRLDVLRQSQMTELELIGAQEQQQRELVTAALSQGLIDHQEYQERLIQIERDAADRRVQLKEAEAQAKAQAEQQFWADAISLMNSGSKTAFRIGKAAALAQAVIKGHSAAVNAWEAGMSTGGPHAPLVAAAYMAASIARTAVLINSIRSASPGGGAGVSVSGSGQISTGTNFNGGAPAANFPQQQPADQAPNITNINVDLPSSGVVDAESVGIILDRIEEAVESGDRVFISRTSRQALEIRDEL